MNAFKPTDEQLFDFYLRESDPVLSQQIREYLKAHPDDAETLDEYHRVATSFHAFPLESPSADILEKVRLQAREHLKKSFWHSLAAALFGQQRLAYGVAAVLVLAIGVYINDMRQGAQQQFAAVTKSASTTLPSSQDPQALASHKNQDATQVSTGALPSYIPSGEITAEQLKDINLKYAQAKDLMTRKLYNEAATLLEQIIVQHPRFEQRIELYSNWIQCLDLTGQTDAAKLRRQELAKILQETKNL